MAMHATPLESEYFAKLRELVIENLPRDLDPRLVIDFTANGPALSIILRESLTRDNLTQALAVIRKRLLLPPSVVINSNATPVIPGGLGLKGVGAEHRGMGKVTLTMRTDGKLYVNGRKVVRYLSPNQKRGKLPGYLLAEELKGDPTLNARILDALYENQQLIPDDWKNGPTYFWATKFCGPGGNLYVEFLCYDRGKWYRHSRWIRFDWNGNEPAARLD